MSGPDIPPPGTVALSNLRRGENATVVAVSDDELRPADRRRLLDLGFTTATAVQCLRRAPWGSPVVYRIGESDLCLRTDLARHVIVQRSA